MKGNIAIQAGLHRTNTGFIKIACIKGIVCGALQTRRARVMHGVLNQDDKSKQTKLVRGAFES